MAKQDTGGREHRLTVLSGPTAVGKGTVVGQLRRQYPNLWYSVSVTTRPARPGEVHGQHYYFVSRAEFERMVDDDQMLEWAIVHGKHLYGTPRKPVEDQLLKSQPVLLELDLTGHRQVREAMPGSWHVFLEPPSFDELIRRLLHRGTETAEDRQRRLHTARLEMAAIEEFDEVIVNDDVTGAAQLLAKSIGLSEQRKR